MAGPWFHSRTQKKPVQEVSINDLKLAVIYKNGKFTVLSNTCPHSGGPIGQGSLEGSCIVCPWHSWKFKLSSGATPDKNASVTLYETKEKGGRLLIKEGGNTVSPQMPKPTHPLDRDIIREKGGLRVLGISTTAMNLKEPLHFR